MHAWRDHKNHIVDFKRKLKQNLMRRVFLVLDHNNALNYRLKLIVNKRSARLQELVIISLL